MQNISKTSRIILILLVFSITFSIYFLLKTVNLQKKPNIILISIDTLRADHLSCYGYKKIETVNIDRLASDGVLFETTIAQAPVTLTSHVSIFTSLYPFSHGVRSNGYKLNSKIDTIAKILKKNSYITAGFVGSAVLDSSTLINQGFDVFNDNFIDYRLPLNPNIYNFFEIGSTFERPASQTNLIVFQWLEKISKNSFIKKRPFFLWVHYWDPHMPYSPPPPYAKPDYNQVQLYDAEIKFVDDCLGSLFQKIHILGLDKKTIYVLTADHGENLGEHGFFAEHGLNLYEPVLRIPLIFKYFPFLQKGKIIQQLARSIDILPTILDLADIKIKNAFQGISLKPIMFGQNMGETREVYFDTFWPPEEKWIGLRNGEWKYTLSSKGNTELYNILDDPYELLNWHTTNKIFKEIKQSKIEYIRIGPKGFKSFFYLPPNHLENIRRAYLYLRDIDTWGTGPSGSPTNISIQINEGNIVNQNPPYSKLLDYPNLNKFVLDTKELRRGINTITVKDEINSFELAMKNGRIYGKLKIEYFGSSKFEINLENQLADYFDSSTEQEKIEEKIKSFNGRFLELIGNNVNIYLNKHKSANKETIEKLKSLGYIK